MVCVGFGCVVLSCLCLCVEVVVDVVVKVKGIGFFGW